MTYRHADEIDRAVLIARRAATAGHLGVPDKLTKFLYQRWYLGRANPQVPRQVARHLGPPATDRRGSAGPWRSWGRLWTEDRTCRGADLVRLHLACAPHTSLHAVAVVTARATAWEHPWLLTSRALNQPLPGPDATVLYLPVAALDELRGPVTALLDELQPFLASGAPALTLRIARGAALAQNPADGRSFGEHRCSLIASSVLANLDQPHREVVHRTLESFRTAHVDPYRPYRALDAEWEWSRRAVAA